MVVNKSHAKSNNKVSNIGDNIAAMASGSAVRRNNKVKQNVRRCSKKRKELSKLSKDTSLDFESRLSYMWKLSKMPRNSSKVRIRNRCAVTGRPRGYYRFFKISRIVLRDFASFGYLPGLLKSSW